MQSTSGAGAVLNIGRESYRAVPKRSLVGIDKAFVFAAVAEERRNIATLIGGLDDARLATPSLCAGWDVKTVAAHLVSVFADSFWMFMGTAVLGGGMACAI